MSESHPIDLEKNILEQVEPRLRALERMVERFTSHGDNLEIVKASTQEIVKGLAVLFTKSELDLNRLYQQYTELLEHVYGIPSCLDIVARYNRLGVAFLMHTCNDTHAADSLVIAQSRIKQIGAYTEKLFFLERELDTALGTDQTYAMQRRELTTQLDSIHGHYQQLRKDLYDYDQQIFSNYKAVRDHWPQLRDQVQDGPAHIHQMFDSFEKLLNAVDSLTIDQDHRAISLRWIAQQCVLLASDHAYMVHIRTNHSRETELGMTLERHAECFYSSVRMVACYAQTRLMVTQTAMFMDMLDVYLAEVAEKLEQN